MSTHIDVSPIATFHWSQTLGEKLRNIRENAGLTREKLKEATGLSLTYIQQIENPRIFLNKSKKPKNMTVSSDVLTNICDVLACDVVSLFWDIEIEK